MKDMIFMYIPIGKLRKFFEISDKISSGLATHPPMRLLCDPEITVFTLKSPSINHVNKVNIYKSF